MEINENMSILCEITGELLNTIQENVPVSSTTSSAILLEDEQFSEHFVETSRSGLLMQNILDEETGEFRATPVPDTTSLKRKRQERSNTRKRSRNPESWKRNIRSSKHQSGETYVSSRGKTVPERHVKSKKDCFDSCRFNCSRAISDDQRSEIFKAYYSMTQNEKYHFVLKTTERSAKKRCTSNTNRKKNSFIFYLEVQGILLRVCKSFYLGTLDISQKVIYGVHERKSVTTGVPRKDQRGQHGKQKRVSEQKKEEVRDHIKSFPVIESHYCRSTTKRKYLEPSLSIAKMYELYVEATSQPVKKSMYCKIFNESFNLAFQKPKKDKCDTCSEWEMAKKERILSDELNEKYTKHQAEKNAMRKVRNGDRESNANVLCFDLQNVLTCPQADVSCFFYKSKLNVYNLTAHFSKTKKAYCAVWTEAQSGRTGNDLASALQKILCDVYEDNPEITSLVLWSDSCVPQNRNSLVSYAVMDFLTSFKNIKEIIIKYSTPGHSGIQEVDNIHSCIERVLSTTEYYSPVSLLKLLKHVNKSNPYRITQLGMADMKDFGACSKQLAFDKIPFTKVTALKFTQNYLWPAYKTSHSEEEWKNVNILPTVQRPQRVHRRNSQLILQFPRDFPAPKPIRGTKQGLPRLKVEALKSMMKWMPLLDKQYFSALFREIGV